MVRTQTIRDTQPGMALNHDPSIMPLTVLLRRLSRAGGCGLLKDDKERRLLKMAEVLDCDRFKLAGAVCGGEGGRGGSVKERSLVDLVVVEAVRAGGGAEREKGEE